MLESQHSCVYLHTKCAILSNWAKKRIFFYLYCDENNCIQLGSLFNLYIFII